MATSASDSRPGFQQELLAIREDPKIRNLALRWAKNPEVAEDGLQTTYCAVSQVADPGAIENLRAYFCRALYREIHRELGQLQAAARDDFPGLVDMLQGRPGSGLPAPRPFTEDVTVSMLGQGWLGAFKA